MGKRYFGLTEEEKRAMMDYISIDSIDELFDFKHQIKINAENERFKDYMDEQSLSNFFTNMYKKNIINKANFIGNGSYMHYIPSAVNAIVSRSEFLTTYTPYQPEISQGVLIAMFEFQELISRITAQDVANSSMYDCATAIVESIMMSIRIRKKRKIFIKNLSLRSQYLDVVKTYSKYFNFDLDHQSASDASCIIIQSPDASGSVVDYKKYYELAKKNNALLIVVVDELLSLGLIEPPRMADIVVGSASSFGSNCCFGGSSIGFLSCKKEFIMQMPGRIANKTKDSKGKDCFSLALCSREQHIRRKNATSNICTNQFLLALAFNVHIALLGEQGFKNLAIINYQRAHSLAYLLSGLKNINLLTNNFFNEFAIEIKNFDPQKFIEKMLDLGISAGFLTNDGKILVSVTELNSEEDIKFYYESAEKILT